MISVFVIILVIFFKFKDKIIKINDNSSIKNNLNDTKITEDFYDQNKFIDISNVKEKLETTPSYYKTSVYKKLNEKEIQKRVQDFILLNGKDWTVDLNEYGFIKKIETTNKDLIKKIHLGKSTEDFLQDHNKYKQTFAFEIATNYKDFLYKNKDFFGLNSYDKLNISGKNIFSKNGVFISSGLKVETNINVLEYNKEKNDFLNKNIVIIPSDDKLTIIGHLWPEVLDLKPVFSYEEMAKN